ncbi:N-acetylmuramic acid 6-phosphate etherase [Qingshengfaniella alkalisoli]|uniref:N-acetylmuramic acid 6-phosphate etherase n=1 Tax=Qingshengfaniella alkalisoli TaxID=2599296 RepID=A0A5B8J975_9RHOB|nr:N-acetylmuramic acid 6-phosphate etherase [Qingshengfaniella alkalisoli]QDY70897.1 N-acetylmuramic acid 6-phosphate etherase [Qingshengfaniella alkalisoli]
MTDRVTEQLNPASAGIDIVDPVAALDRLQAAQEQALASVRAAHGQIAAAADLAADRWNRGGRLIYAGAGSSGLAAISDALELPGTFGLPPHRIVPLMAGGIPQDEMPGDTEDFLDEDMLSDLHLAPADCVLGITASGTTAFTTQLLASASEMGSATIAVANNVSAPIFEFADISILLETPPEIVAGSTRMGTGTAQKAAMNMFSTLLGIKLGHIHDGMMINLRADNAKLRQRAAGIVMRIADVEVDAAVAALTMTDSSVKEAVLYCLGVTGSTERRLLLDRHRGILRAALSELEAESPG